MKSLLASIALGLSCFSFQAHAAPNDGAQDPTLLVSESIEIKAIVAGVEQNRQLKCSPINKASTKVSKNHKLTTNISCNQYDADGNPQANVHVIQITGWISPDWFDLVSLKIVPLE